MSFKTGIGSNYIATNSTPQFTTAVSVLTVDQPNALSTKSIVARTKDLFTNITCPQTVAFFGSYTLATGQIPSRSDWPGTSQASVIAVMTSSTGTLGIDMLAASGGGAQVGLQIIGGGTVGYVANSSSFFSPVAVPINIPAAPVPISCTFMFTQ